MQRRLDSVHLPTPEGTKEAPVPPPGGEGGWLWWCGGVTPINPPQLPPQRVGVMSGMSQVPLSPWCTVFGNPSPSILSCYTQPPPTYLPPTPHTPHPLSNTHTSTNTPPGQCVLWSLTLNRPPRLNTTDRQASGHQVHRPKSCLVAQ